MFGAAANLCLGDQSPQSNWPTAALYKGEKLPNKQSLDQVLSVELNAEFERLRAEYAPRNSSIRKPKTLFAAEKLMQEATGAVGLEDDAERIERKLAKLVKRHDCLLQNRLLKPLRWTFSRY